MTTDEKLDQVLQACDLIEKLKQLDADASKGSWIATPDGFRVWSDTTQNIICYTATNNTSRTEQARRNASMVAELRSLLPNIIQALERI